MAGPSGGASGPLNNLAATRLPTINDDALSGYGPGSRWLYPVTGDMLTCRDATPGAAQWLKVDPSDHPGYTGNRVYLPFGHGAPASGVATAANTIYLACGGIKQRTPIAQLGAAITTAVSGGNFQLAIYRHNIPTAGPGLFTLATGSGSTGAADAINIGVAGGATFVEPGTVWFGCNQDVAGVVFMALGLASPSHMSLVGHPTRAIPAGTSNASQGTGYSTPQTFGTWPADLSGATLTPVAIGRNPMIHYLVPLT